MRRSVPPAPEAYITRREVARLMGLCPDTVDKLVRDAGLPSVTWGLRTRRFRWSEIESWNAARENERRAA